MTTHGSRASAPPAPPNVWAPILLVAVNAVPLVGVLLFDWRLFDLMLLYWLENGVIGVFTVLKILASKAPPGEGVARVAGGVLGKASVAVFFIFHYGVFWAVHGMFVFFLFGGGFGAAFGGAAYPPPAFGGAPFGPGAAFGGVPFGPAPAAAVSGTVSLALVSLVLSHGASYLTNYLGRGEDRSLTPVELMGQPYSRVLVLHGTILGGGLVVMLLGTPIAALLLLVALKTGVDLSAHLRERRAAALARERSSARSPLPVGLRRRP